MKILSTVFAVLALVLSHTMCAVVAYGYCDLTWGSQYAGYSASADTAFCFAIPYLIGIAVCGVLAAIFQKKSRP